MDFGLSHIEFWELSWYEWGLYHRRHERKILIEKTHNEGLWAMTRTIWATIMNRHRGKKEPVYKPQDLVKLSFDKEQEKQEQESKLLTAEETEALIKERFKTNHGRK